MKLGVFPAIADSSEFSPFLMISSTNPNEELTFTLSLSLPDIDDAVNGTTLPALILE